VVTVQRFSRPPHSTALPFLLYKLKTAAFAAASIPVVRSTIGTISPLASEALAKESRRKDNIFLIF
jgi:hypothetical protein